MRKPVSLIIVGAMILTLFGLFGGVVEEVVGGATYDSGTNTIIVTSSNNNLDTIGLTIDESIFWYNSSDDSYSTKANILVDNGAVLEFLGGDILKFNKNMTDELNLTVKGTIECIGVNPLNMVTFTSNESVPSSGDWEGIRFITAEAEGSNVNFINLSYPQIGLYFYTSSTNVSNSIINSCSDNGIKSNDADPILDNIEISTIGNGESNDAGMLVFSSSPIVKNSTFLNNLNKDILLDTDSHPILLNTSFDSGKIDFDDSLSNLTVKWFLNIYVEDVDTQDPVSNAVVIVKDSFGNEVYGNPFTTDSLGYVRWIQAVNYVRNYNPPFIEPHTPHNITVSHDEYYTNYTEVTIDSSMQVQVNLTMIRRDLTTNPENITFSPPGVPVAGENLTIYAKIHNIEVEDAHDVRVIIIDIAPEGSQVILNVSIGKVEGKSFEYAISLWQPSPGSHTINVTIDPYYEINEINSNPLIPAEENNNVSVNINVNARPEVNITEPGNNATINGTIFINGTAFDDARDDVWDPTNNITRIDIRLEGYDWIEPTPPYLFPNLSEGNWNWYYEWEDTTQWNGTPIPDGNYTIQARAWDNYHLSYLDEIKITVNNTGANAPPEAVISYPEEPNAFNVSDVITFDASGSNDNETTFENLNFTWDFDANVDSDEDGNLTNDEDGYGDITTYAYDAKGFFNVTLKVTDEGGLNDTDLITIWVNNYRPVVNMTASNTTVYENDTVTFNGSDSYDPDGSIINYVWDFDDGIILITTWPVVEVNHSFNESRLFNVTLTVTDNTGYTTNTTWIYIDVLANAVPTSVIDDPDQLDTFSVDEIIFFNGSGSSDLNDEDLEYRWEFGDGENTTWMIQPTTTHSYADYTYPITNYIVTLTVRDDEGLEDSTSITIFIDNYPPVAVASSNVTSSLTYQDITFDGSGSYDDDGTVSSYE
ncbi:MAG: PKD domain-containing protein, partial [Thermoplasmata archaeon]